MSTQETYAEKIAKLLRKAESTTPEEAEMLFAKAQELMAKYAIDEAMIAAASGTQSDDPIVVEEFVVTGIYRYPLGDLVGFTLQFNGVKHVLIVGQDGRAGPPRRIGGKLFKQTLVFEATGYKSDIERCRMLVASLQLQALRAESEWWRTVGQLIYRDRTHSQQHVQRRGFLYGFAQGAGVKMRDATQRGRKAAEEEHGASSVALVLQSREMKLQAEWERMNPDLETFTDTKRNRGENIALNSGYEQGQRADVGQETLGNQKELA